MRQLLWFVFVLLTVLPVITYLVYHYRQLGTRRKQLLDTLLSLSLDSEYMLMRHGQEFPTWRECPPPKRTDDFLKLYFDLDFRVGSSHPDYFWPVLLFTMLSGVGWALTLHLIFPGFSGLQGADGFLPEGFAYGFIAAYLACVLAIFDSFRTYALDPGLYYSLSFRLMFASFAAYVTSLVFRTEFTPIVAVGVGLFPLEKTWSFITQQAAQRLGVSEPEKELGAELANIQGLEDHRNRQKLLDVGITTIQALATADPFFLFFNTTLPLRTVVDMIDKAILYLYIGENVTKLRQHGINGVIELVALAKLAEKVPAYRGPTPASGVEPLSPLFNKIDTENVITQIGQVLGQTPDELKTFIYNMYYDPMVKFIYEIWGRYLRAPVEKAVADPPLGQG